MGSSGAYTGRFFGKAGEREKRRAKHAMLSDRHPLEKLSEASDDLLRTSIAMDHDGVKTPAASQSPPSGRVSPVESGHGSGRQWRLEPGQRLAGAAAGAEGRDGAATATGMVLSSASQSRSAPLQLGRGNVLRALVALGAGVVARAAARTGSGARCHHAGATLYGAVCERAGAWLCHSGGLESVGLQSKGVLAALLATPAGTAGWGDPSRLDSAGL